MVSTFVGYAFPNADLAFGAFSDLEASVRASLGRLRANPWLRPGPVHGLIFDVGTGRLHEVADA